MVRKTTYYILNLVPLFLFGGLSSVYANNSDEFFTITAPSGLAAYHTLNQKRLDYGVPTGTTLQILERGEKRNKVRYCLDERRISRQVKSADLSSIKGCSVGKLRTVWVTNRTQSRGKQSWQERIDKPVHYSKLFPSDENEEIVKQAEEKDAAREAKKETFGGLRTTSPWTLREDSWSGHTGKVKCDMGYNLDLAIVSKNTSGWVDVMVSNPEHMSDKCRKKACIEEDPAGKPPYFCKTWGGTVWVGNSTKHAWDRIETPGLSDDYQSASEQVQERKSEATSCLECDELKNQVITEEAVSNMNDMNDVTQYFHNPTGAHPPLKGRVELTDYYHVRKFHPVTGKKMKPHTGLDIVSDSDNFEVYSVLDGKVVDVWDRERSNRVGGGKWPYRGWGNIVVIETMVGGERRHIMYSHLAYKSSKGLKKGDRVTKGQVIGRIGNTGTATGYHLDLTYCDPGQKNYCSKSTNDFINPALLFSNDYLTSINPRRLALWKGDIDAG